MRVDLSRQNIWIADGSEVGENLYKGSLDFSGTWINGGNWTTADEKFNNFTVKQRNNVWGGLAQNISATLGDVFSISFWAKIDAGGRLQSVHRSNLGNVTTGLDLLKGNFSSSNIWVDTNEDGTQWRKYWATLQIISEDITYLQWRIENSISGKNLQVCGMKLEKGSTPTPWLPNSADNIYISSTVPFTENNNNNQLYIGDSWISANQFYQI